MRDGVWETEGADFLYEVCREGIRITGLQGAKGKVTVPSQIEDSPVVAIGKKAFLSQKNLRNVSLPESITEVGDWAFAYCGGLEMLDLPNRELRFGKSVFLECPCLSAIRIAEKKEFVGVLLAAAVTVAQAPYLLDVTAAGNSEWLAKWDARMLDILHRPDDEGYSRQVLCGEEDYGSTDLNAYLGERRREKARLLLLRLLYPDRLDERVEREVKDYLRNHTKGCDSEEAWQVVLKEHGEDCRYYRLFTEIGCVDKGNFEALMEDIGADYPEMKAYLMRYHREQIGSGDFFEGLEF